jgi:enoyl-CoA hydratase
MITLEIRGAIAHLQLSRPKKLNAMNWSFWEEMPNLIEQINDSDDVRVAVLSAAGKAFSVGLDFFDVIPKLGIDAQGPDGARQRALHRLIAQMQWSVTCVERCRVPVIAAIHGYCLGGAIDLITACDMRFSASDATFGVRETKMAIVADLGTLQRLPRLIAPGIARELILTGRDFDAGFAAQIGLINHVLPDREALMTHALSVAEEIANNPPLTVQGAKTILNQQYAHEIDRELEYVATFNAAHLLTQDLAEAVQSFATKKPPHFKGR